MSIVRSIEINHYEHMFNRNWDKTYWVFDIHGTILKPNYEYGNIPKEFYPFAKTTLQFISGMKDVVKLVTHPIKPRVGKIKSLGADEANLRKNKVLLEEDKLMTKEFDLLLGDE